MKERIHIILSFAFYFAAAHSSNRFRECKQSTIGTAYTGRLNTTISGKVCQRWDAQTPHSHTFGDIRMFPDFSMEELSNYCRHPDGGSDAPWCFTMDSATRWEYCEIPDCSTYPECKITDMGQEYRGFLSLTGSGKVCMNWDRHLSNFNGEKRIKDLTDDGNYCRNPNSNPRGPWCWVTDSEWEYCEVKFCKPSASCRNTENGVNYVGTKSVTETGQTCQRWDRQAPHSHPYTDPDTFPDKTLDEASNYCRLPNNDAEEPWCYTVNPDIRWELCDIPICPECKTSTSGREYAGVSSITTNDLQCQRWDSQTPHPHNMTEPERFPDASLAEASNYCRNPDNKAGGPWCFTTDSGTTWDYCNLTMCTECNDQGKAPLKRRVKHVVQIGVDGMRADCIAGAPGGAPNLLERLPREGTFTLTKARTTFVTMSMPGWGSIFCGMPLESTGIRSNSWRPPWMGQEEAITPITGKNVPMPCGFVQVKAMDATVHTAAFHAWTNFKEFFSHGNPKSLDREMFCTPVDSIGMVCDEWLKGNVTEFISQIAKSAHSSWLTFNIDVLDYVGHSLGWCSQNYSAAMDSVDRHVGDILDAIDATNEDFLFMLSADHGGNGYSHGAEADTDLWVPMYIRGPTVKKQHQFQHEVRVQDIVPTGLYALGLEQNPFQLGQVMTEAFEDEAI